MLSTISSCSALSGSYYLCNGILSVPDDTLLTFTFRSLAAVAFATVSWAWGFSSLAIKLTSHFYIAVDTTTYFLHQRRRYHLWER